MTFDWGRCNRTELYQLCRKAHLHVHPADSKERLIAVLQACEEDLPVNHPIDGLRDAIAVFVDDFWVKLQSQLTCPAKNHTLNCCYGCLDQQVVACLVKPGADGRPNKQIERQILIRRKKT